MALVAQSEIPFDAPYIISGRLPLAAFETRVRHPRSGVPVAVFFFIELDAMVRRLTWCKVVPIAPPSGGERNRGGTGGGGGGLLAANDEHAQAGTETAKPLVAKGQYPLLSLAEARLQAARRRLSRLVAERADLTTRESSASSIASKAPQVPMLPERGLGERSQQLALGSTTGLWPPMNLAEAAALGEALKALSSRLVFDAAAEPGHRIHCNEGALWLSAMRMTLSVMACLRRYQPQRGRLVIIGLPLSNTITERLAPELRDAPVGLCQILGEDFTFVWASPVSRLPLMTGLDSLRGGLYEFEASPVAAGFLEWSSMLHFGVERISARFAAASSTFSVPIGSPDSTYGFGYEAVLRYLVGPSDASSPEVCVARPDIFSTLCVDAIERRPVSVCPSVSLLTEQIVQTIQDTNLYRLCTAGIAPHTALGPWNVDCADHHQASHIKALPAWASPKHQVKVTPWEPPTLD